jgi:beta-glucanase (GH16 family)
MLRRWLTLTVAALLVAPAVVAIAPAGPASALAPPPFNAGGTVRCTMKGNHTIKPGITAAPRPNVVETIKATLTCSSGSTGQSAVTLKSGKLTATSVPAALSCSSPLSPPLAATIKWTATGGKVNPTKVVWMGSNNTTSPRMGRSYPASTTVTGSYAGGTARMAVVSDVLGQAACTKAGGLKKLAFTGVGGASTFEIPSSPPQVTQLFRDDFNGTALDRSKWRPNWFGTNDTAVTKPVNTKEQGCYDPAQVSVGLGVLRLSAVARSCRANNGITYPYASGIVTTKDHFTFRYGYFEARLWTPPGSGPIRNWPAFWANGTGQHPLTGEIDVVEGLAGRACWHFHFKGGAPGGCVNKSNVAGWHTYAAEWRQGVVTYFYDGEQVGRITQGITSTTMYVVLNLGVSSTVSGPVTLPAEMLVDYVKVTT